MQRIVILTGSELRHQYCHYYFANHPRLNLLCTLAEGSELSLRARLEKSDTASPLQLQHAASRARVEEDFFGLYVQQQSADERLKLIPKGAINETAQVQLIRDLKPDLIVAYGCSLIKSDLVIEYQRRFVNLHLGLSPYYRGSGTNYFPLVNNHPEYVGATWMYLDPGIDTGEIIHQITARIFADDTIHTLGNRLILDAIQIYAELVARFSEVQPQTPLQPSATDRCYYRKDFTHESLVKLQQNFATRMLPAFLEDEHARRQAVPLIEQPFLQQVGRS